MAKEMVWIDLEMTGLDIEVESIIEIATIITDAELNIIAQGPNLTIKVSDELLEGMDEWNTTHHTASGLVDRVRNEGVSLGEAIRQTCEFLSENIRRARRHYVATLFTMTEYSWQKKCQRYWICSTTEL